MKAIFILLAVFLYAKTINIFVDKSFKYEVPEGFKVYKFNSVKQLKNPSMVIVNYNDLPYLIKNNYYILRGIGEIETYIYSHKNIDEIKSVANANFPAKIFVDSITNAKYVKASLNDFLARKVDAYVTNKRKDIEGVKFYDLDDLGIEFDKYYVGVKKDLLILHKDQLEEFVNFYPSVKLNSSLILSAHYLNHKVKISPYFFNYLLEKEEGELKVAFTPYWPPFNFNDKGELVGISVDFWKLIAKKADIDYEIITESSWKHILKEFKEGKYDVIPNTSKTAERKKYAIFTKPYAEFPLAIACRDDLKIDKIDQIKSIAVGENYTAYKMMKEHYPHLNYLLTKNTLDAVELVKHKTAQCFVDIYPSVVWAVKEKGIGYIKIYFKTDFTFKLMIMLRKDLVELKERLNKAIDSLSDMEKQKIITKYIDEKLLLKDNNNYKMWFYVSFGLLIFMSFLLYEYLRHKKKASLDPLTKVLNRGAIEDILKKKLKDSNGSVILFDIDYFKKINDNYGHNKGDEVLKELAKIVKSTLRKTDYIGRWGGEEFVILLPEVEFEDALKVAEKIRNKIEKSNIGGLNVTVSLGVSSFKKGDNLQLVIKKADDALYSAKENGRNQVKGIK